MMNDISISPLSRCVRIDYNKNISVSKYLTELYVLDMYPLKN